MPSEFRSDAWRRVLLFCAVAAVSAAHAADTPGMAEFKTGVASYRAGDYEAALAAFLDARHRGLDIPNLHFNLGLTYYRLARYPDARGAFERLRQFPDYAAMADFHLGLVAARLGEQAHARELWRSVAREATQAALRDRAEIAQDRLESGPAARVATAYVLAAAGRDSNPALVDESVQTAGESDSTTFELFGAFDYPLTELSAAATILRGGVYTRDYGSDSGFDQHGFFAGLSRESASGSRRRSFFADASGSYLDGERFTNTYSAGVQTTPQPGGTGLTLRGLLSRIVAAESYGYLEGWRLRADAELRGEAGSARLRAGYQFEINDRADLAAGNEFFSHSPLRHRLGLTLDHPASGRWFLQWSARYRYSEYRDPNRFMDSGTRREERRVEALAQAGLQARRKLGPVFNGLLEYQYSHNAATIDAFDYQRHLVLIGLEWLPHGE